MKNKSDRVPWLGLGIGDAHESSILVSVHPLIHSFNKYLLLVSSTILEAIYEQNRQESPLSLELTFLECKLQCLQAQGKALCS